MGILDTIRQAFAPPPPFTISVQPNKALESYNLMNATAGFGGGYPGTWNRTGVVLPPIERNIKSIILNAALTRLGNEMAGARVVGIEDSPYPNFPFRDMLKAMARRAYLDGGWLLWERLELTPMPDVQSPVYTLFAPQDLQEIGAQPGVSPPTAYRYNRGNSQDAIEIPAEQIGIYQSQTRPPQADVRLRDAIKVELAAVSGQAQASQNAARPRLHIAIDHKNRRPAVDRALNNADGDTSGIAKDVQETLSALTNADVVPTYAGETLNVLNYSADTQFGLVLNNIAQLVSADSGIPAPFLASTENLTFANIVQLTRVMYESVIIPLGKEFADVIRRRGTFPNFDLDFSQHYAVQQSAAERALLIDRIATAVERLVRAGFSRPDALQIVIAAGVGVLAEFQQSGRAAAIADADNAAISAPGGA